jgi:hypothetical protein
VNPEAPEKAPADDGSRPPRAALIIVAVGLVACLVAALATTGKGDGEAAHLEWVQAKKFPDSSAVKVPGGTQTMHLGENLIQATGTNVATYSLFRVRSELVIQAGAPIGKSRAFCSVAGGNGAEIAQTSGGLRATYPRSSDAGIFKQEVPETILADFSSHGSELAVLEVADLPKRFANERGVKLDWPEFEEGTENLHYFLNGGPPTQDVRLPFYTVWKATRVPAAKISCELTTSAGTATAKTEVSLPKISPPIDEEAEEEEQERREETETTGEEETDESGGEGE